MQGKDKKQSYLEADTLMKRSFENEPPARNPVPLVDKPSKITDSNGVYINDLSNRAW